jgi:hypothetical protein
VSSRESRQSKGPNYRARPPPGWLRPAGCGLGSGAKGRVVVEGVPDRRAGGDHGILRCCTTHTTHCYWCCCCYYSYYCHYPLSQLPQRRTLGDKVRGGTPTTRDTTRHATHGRSHILRDMGGGTPDSRQIQQPPIKQKQKTSRRRWSGGLHCSGLLLADPVCGSLWCLSASQTTYTYTSYTHRMCRCRAGFFLGVAPPCLLLVAASCGCGGASRSSVGTRHCFAYIGSPPTALFNGQTPFGMSNTNAMKQLRGPKHENWPACDPRAAPPGEYGLKSLVKMGT